MLNVQEDIQKRGQGSQTESIGLVQNEVKLKHHKHKHFYDKMDNILLISSIAIAAVILATCICFQIVTTNKHQSSVYIFSTSLFLSIYFLFSSTTSPFC